MYIVTLDKSDSSGRRFYPTYREIRLIEFHNILYWKMYFYLNISNRRISNIICEFIFYKNHPTWAALEKHFAFFQFDAVQYCRSFIPESTDTFTLTSEFCCSWLLSKAAIFDIVMDSFSLSSSPVFFLWCFLHCSNYISFINHISYFYPSISNRSLQYRQRSFDA